MGKTKTPDKQSQKTTSKDKTSEEYRALNREDLDKLAGEPLPERAAMSLINANVDAPVNAAIALNVLSDNSQAIAIEQQEADISQDNQRTRRRVRMAEQTEGYKTLSREELEQLVGEPLPERAAMSLVNANIAIPINASIAANVLSDNAIAYAEAAQQTPIDQEN